MQKEIAIKYSSLALTQPPIVKNNPKDSMTRIPSFPSPHSHLNPSNGEERDTTMILALTISGHNHLHEPNHSDSDKQ